MLLKRCLALFFVLSIFAISFAHAQADRKSQQKDTVAKWTVGTDLLWLIDKNQLPPINLQIKKKHNENSAWRLRVGIAYNSNDSSYNSMGWPGPPFKSRNFTGFIRVGWETEKQLKNDLSFYSGIDLGGWYENQIIKRTWYWQEVSTYVRIDYEVGSSTYELLPFFGLNFKINRVMIISLESTIRLYYRHDKHLYNGAALPNYPGVAVGDYKSINHKTGITIIPIQFLNLNLKIK